MKLQSKLVSKILAVKLSSLQSKPPGEELPAYSLKGNTEVLTLHYYHRQPLKMVVFLALFTLVPRKWAVNFFNEI